MRDPVDNATTFLFVPGNRPDRFGKAASSGADIVILDLEDAVPAAQKHEAREAASSFLAGGGRVCVRVNPLGSGELDADLAAVGGSPGLLGLMVAKADHPSVIHAAGATSTPIIALIESASGVAAAYEIASSPQVARLAFGHLDYAVDIGARPSHTAMLHARSALVLASRRAGLPGPIDGVTAALDDTEALLGDVDHATDVGMSGKLLVHPRQVAPVTAAFRPDKRAVEWAQGVLDGAGSGEAVRIGGEMVDAPVIARAQAILRQTRSAPRSKTSDTGKRS
ncbi:HpcH/HpaI aldolase/citrate lyase family protein [Nocardia fusca]|uniref:HpcH/HpaI aldolase/citrate lyase family protein n=1 Tax=Nocardia fusca TaxID=941183 RepID=UPI003794688C